MKPIHKGFVVDIDGHQRKPFTHRGASFRVLTAADFAMTTLVVAVKANPQSELHVDPVPSKITAPVIPSKVPPTTQHRYCCDICRNSGQK